mmetsp:Transcript_32369/g.54173  ORF Transcript_32369/g.54173 Transcript_32369/m.54173 type:complete len:110 (+) Transcript_32369:1427-1756(+)
MILLIQPVRNGSCRWFVDDTLDRQSSNSSCILGGLPLCIVEIGRYRDDGVLDGLSQVGFGRFFHFPKHHGANFFGRELRFGISRQGRRQLFWQLYNGLAMFVFFNVIRK